MLNFARHEAEQGPVQAPRVKRAERPTVTLLGEMFPADPVQIGSMLELMGLAAGPVVPTREWRELYGALDCAAVAAIHPFYAACVREFELAGRPILGSAPVGLEGTEAWLEAIGEACGVTRDVVGAAKTGFSRRSRRPWRRPLSRAGSRFPVTRARSFSLPVSWSKAAPTFAMSARPVPARSYPRQMPPGFRRKASTSNSGLPCSRTWRRSPNTSPTLRSA